MATYKEQIEGLIGVTSPVVPTDRYDDYLNDGAQELINLVPKDVLWTLSTSASILSGQIDSVVISGDAVYSDQPTLTFSAPTTDNGTTATATVLWDDTGATPAGDGTISTVAITNNGEGYTTPPTITLTGTLDSGTSTYVVTLKPGYINLSTNAILSVSRETESLVSDTTGNGTSDTTASVECREISVAAAGRVTPGSGWLEEVTENDPIFYKSKGRVYVLPKPVNNGCVVEYASVPSTLLNGANLTIMPPELDYLVVMIAAVKSLNHHINSVVFPALTSSLYTDETLTSLLNGPDFTAVDSSFAIAFADYPAVDNNLFLLASGSYVDFSATPTYTAPSPALDLSTEIAALQTYITDEDLDLAGAQTQLIQVTMSEYQAEQQDSNSTFQASVNDTQNLLQEAIQEKGIQMSAAEKEKNLQLIMVKSKLERRVQAINEVMQKHSAKVQVLSSLLQEFSASLNLWDAKKKQKQELQISLMNSYNAGVQALLTRYKSVSSEVSHPQVQQQMQQGQR